MHKKFLIVLLFSILFTNTFYSQHFDLVKEFESSESRWFYNTSNSEELLFVHEEIVDGERADYVEFADGSIFNFEQGEFFLAYHFNRVFTIKDCLLKVSLLVGNEPTFLSSIFLDNPEVCLGNIYPIGNHSVLLTNEIENSGNYIEIYNYINGSRSVLVSDEWYQHILYSNNDSSSSVLLDLQNGKNNFLLVHLNNKEVKKKYLEFERRPVSIMAYQMDETIISFLPTFTVSYSAKSDRLKWSEPVFISFENTVPSKGNELIFYDLFDKKIKQINLDEGKVLSSEVLGIEDKKCVRIFTFNDTVYTHLSTPSNKQNYLAEIDLVTGEILSIEEIPIEGQIGVKELGNQILFFNEKKIVSYGKER